MPKLRAAALPDVVTTIHATRPLLSVSSVARLRANLSGFSNDVETVHTEPESLGYARNDCDQRQRVEQAHLAAVAQHGVEITPAEIGERQHVGEEQGIQLAQLQHARDVFVIVGLQ